MPGYTSDVSSERYEFTKDTPAQEVVDKIENADRITQVQASFDTKKMREDGALLKGDDYSPELFVVLFEGMCRNSKAEFVRFRAKPVLPNGRSSWGYCGITVVERKGKYVFSHIGLWRFAWNLMYELEVDNSKCKHLKLLHAMVSGIKTAWYMAWNRKFRDTIRDTMRRWMWRQMPASIGEDILNRPEGRQPNGDHDISAEGMNV